MGVRDVPPFFSVLIPTRERAELAAGCVGSLLAQDHPSFEILVLDQTAGGETRQAVERAAAGSGRVRVVRLSSRGRSRALNAGIPLARGRWIVMIDDDCQPLPGWLATLEEEVRRARVREVIVGRVLPGEVPEGMAEPPATIEDPEPAEYSGRIARDLVYPNFAVPAEAFAELGLFDERMGVGTPLPGGEDNDFGYRLLRSGWRILYRPEPTVIHRAWRTPEARAALKKAYGLGQGAFYAKHLARLDPFIAFRFVRDVLKTARAVAGAAIRGRPAEARGHLAFLAGMISGALRMAGLILRRVPAVGPEEGSPDSPTAPRVLDLELSGLTELPESIGRGGFRYVLFRWKGRPVGRLVLETTRRIDLETLRREAIEASAAGLLSAEIERASPHSELAGLRAGGGTDAARGVPVTVGDVSVVIATRDRTQDLKECLASLRALDPPPGEIVVVDSASARPDEVAAVAEGCGARLVRVDRPGLSRARNAGAEAAKGRIVAFLDDDCRVDGGWLRALCRGFSDPAVEAVTGQLLPGEVDTAAQRAFLLYSHMDRRGFAPRRFDRDAAVSPYWPVDAWRMGSGGNLALRAGALRRLGGFSAALGLGTPARGGEDLFLLWSVIRSEGAVVYRPDATAWHRHHRSWEALREVLYGYGAGHTAYLRAIRAAGTPAGRLRRYRLSFLADRAARWLRAVAGLSPLPGSLVVSELAGSLAGGRLARQAEREARREAAERKAADGNPAGAPRGLGEIPR